MNQHGHQEILQLARVPSNSVQSNGAQAYKAQPVKAQPVSWRGFSFVYMTCLFFTLLWFPFATVHAQSTIRLRLVQTVNTSSFSRPSPDPSGIVYLSDTGILYIVDGEVDEIPSLFKGDAVFGLRLPNQFVYSRSVFSFSHEPSGVGFNPRLLYR
jgi:hypothetical protein